MLWGLGSKYAVKSYTADRGYPITQVMAGIIVTQPRQIGNAPRKLLLARAAWLASLAWSHITCCRGGCVLASTCRIAPARQHQLTIASTAMLARTTRNIATCALPAAGQAWLSGPKSG